MSVTLSDKARSLLSPWAGPYGGLPPLENVDIAALEEAISVAIEWKRSEVNSIASNNAPPTFANTAEALEDSGRALARVLCVFRVYANSQSLGNMPTVAQRVPPLLAALDDEIAHDERLFARLNAVWNSDEIARLTDEKRRLLAVLIQRMRRRGAGLAPAAKKRLAQISGRLAALSSQYDQNLIEEASRQAVLIEDDSALDGLPDRLRQAAAAAAADMGRPGVWAIPNTRGAVWPFLTLATRRDLREQVWRMWTNRGDNRSANDNKPVAQEILLLRGELARLLGYPSYAHLALSDRMARTPQAALSLLEQTWASVKPMACAQLADYQAIADQSADECTASAPLAPWDRQFYAEKLRRQRFGLDGDAVKAYFPLENVLQAMFWAAGRVHGLSFTPIADAPLIHPSVRVYAVNRASEAIGVLYFDLFNRQGKSHGSYQMQYREAERFAGRVLPISAIYSTFPAPPHGQPALLPWEYANVFFHEFGHALHMLHCTSAYVSLGSQHVAWDFVELPALINERWLRDAELLHRFAHHHLTDEPMPNELLDRIEQGLKYDRPFSLNPDYLMPAIVDLRLHLMADGSGKQIDPVKVENDTLIELGMPEAWDVIMRVTHNPHVFVGAYAAGLYSYLWADVMAADAVRTFEESPDGIYDAATSKAWIDQILSVGHRVAAEAAFRSFAGHDPDPMPLLRRFELWPALSTTKENNR
ncbi:MAG: M3 family metallopeptidase [Rhodocyclaceae bacterium]|nr:M3 family metallopeptidase [Rhodocyclaceae bacterium]